MKKILAYIFYSISRVAKILLLIFSLVFLLVIGFSVYFNAHYQDKALPNIYFYGNLVSDMTSSDIGVLIKAKESSLPQKATLSYLDKTRAVDVVDIGFVWDRKKTEEKILNVGKEESLFGNFLAQVKSLLYKNELTFSYDFDEDKARVYLLEMAKEIDLAVIDSKLTMEGEKVKEFALGSFGRKLNMEVTTADLKRILAKGESTVGLTIDEIKPQGSEDLARLGIRELVAVGESNFAGSSANRIHNIRTGGQMFDGALIKSGETFSFNTLLGEVSAETGYKKEFVIKQDKTVPEYGGGLCQVSTTFFRAALHAGFPIVERTPHAYRVTYYEPAGMDATIYDIKPDLIFKNDTKNNILVETGVEGNNLFVYFYGTKDGREVSLSKPVVYNLVPPGEPQETETDTLAPGERKQVDIAHTGADAYFTRAIKYADGTKKDERFDSHYIPWKAKFLVGKDIKEAPDAPVDTAPKNPAT